MARGFFGYNEITFCSLQEPNYIEVTTLEARIADMIQQRLEEGMRLLEQTTKEKIDTVMRTMEERLQKMEEIICTGIREETERRKGRKIVFLEKSHLENSMKFSPKIENDGRVNSPNALEGLQARVTALEASVHNTVSSIIPRIEALSSHFEYQSLETNVCEMPHPEGYLSSIDCTSVCSRTSEDVGEALIEAAKQGTTQEVRARLQWGIDVNTRGSDGCTALHWASRRGHTEVLSLLLRSGADVSVREEQEWTALHWAAANDQALCVSLLVDAGGKVNSRDGSIFERTPLHLAAAAGNVAAATALLEAGACTTVTMSNGMTPVDLAKDDHMRHLLSGY